MDKQLKALKLEEKVEKKVLKKAIKKDVKKKMGGYPTLQHAAVRESAYLRTIFDPVNVVGVKIPDEVTTPSFTAQVLTKFIVQTAAGLAPNTAQVGACFTRTLGKTTGVAGDIYTANPSVTANQYGPFSGSSVPWAGQFNSQCASYRLVSAKATMSYLGAPNNASGRFLMAFVSPNNLMQYNGSGNLALSGVGAGQNLLSTNALVDVPASKLYAECRYVPLDPIACSYETSGSSATGTIRQAGSGAATYGSFIGCIDGCPAGQSVEINIWENYECIPQTSIVNLVQPQPSLSDPMEMAAAFNVLSSVPTVPTMQSFKDSVQATAQAAPSAAPMGNGATSTHSVTKSDEKPFTEKLLSGAGSLIDMGKKAAPLITEIAALL